MVVAQLVKWSLPTLEMPGSNPAIGKLYITYLLSNVSKRQKEKKKRLGLAHFLRKKLKNWHTFTIFFQVVKFHQNLVTLIETEGGGDWQL